MIAGDVHSSLDDPPTTSMFARAGDGSTKRSKSGSTSSLTDALSQVAVVLSSTLSPRPQSNSPTHSPAKQTEVRSKCYKQLSDLNNLRQEGILSEEEYSSERHAVLQVLKSLQSQVPKV